MTHKFFCLCAFSLATIAAPALADFKPIKKAKHFQQHLVGRKLTQDNGNWTIINSDGTQSGAFNGKPYVGSWKWQGRYWCRNGTLGGTELGTDCQLVERDGNIARFTRDKGKGRVGNPFTIN